MTKPKTPLELVKAFRAAGLTQLQIEERTGIPQSAISKIEREQVHDVLSQRYLALQRLYAELFPDECACTSAPKNNGSKGNNGKHAGGR